MIWPLDLKTTAHISAQAQPLIIGPSSAATTFTRARNSWHRSLNSLCLNLWLTLRYHWRTHRRSNLVLIMFLVLQTHTPHAQAKKSYRTASRLRLKWLLQIWAYKGNFQSQARERLLFMLTQTLSHRVRPRSNLCATCVKRLKIQAAPALTLVSWPLQGKSLGSGPKRLRSKHKLLHPRVCLWSQSIQNWNQIRWQILSAHCQICLATCKRCLKIQGPAPC